MPAETDAITETDATGNGCNRKRMPKETNANDDAHPFPVFEVTVQNKGYRGEGVFYWALNKNNMFLYIPACIIEQTSWEKSSKSIC